MDGIACLDEQHSEYWKLLHFLLVYPLYNIYIMVLKAPEDLSGQVSLIMSFPFMRGRRERQGNYSLLLRGCCGSDPACTTTL